MQMANITYYIQYYILTQTMPSLAVIWHVLSGTYVAQSVYQMWTVQFQQFQKQERRCKWGSLGS